MSPPAISTRSPDADRLLKGLIDGKVLDAGRARSAWQAYEGETEVPDVRSLAEFLIARGLLSAYQAERALAGDAGKLLLGPYLLLEPLGAGHWGSVFLAVHRGDRRRFAVKVLPLRSLWRVRQVKKQADLFRTLPAHSAIVPLAEIDTANGSHYLSWPFVEGETLAAIVARTGPLPPDEAGRLFSEVAEGLAICHGAGLFHGLLNPANLAVGHDGKARILDLGVGAVLAENPDDESMLDTISSANSALDAMGYCAPETIADPSARTAQADVYSLGCALHAVCGGEEPFPTGGVVDKMIAHQTRMPTPLRTRNPAIPQGLDDLVRAMMRKAPAERPDLGEVKAALDALASGTPADAPPPAPDLPPETPAVSPAAADDTPEPAAFAYGYKNWPTILNSEGCIDFDVPGAVRGETPSSHRPSTLGAVTRPPVEPPPKALARAIDAGASVPELLLPATGSHRTLTLPASARPAPLPPPPAVVEPSGESRRHLLPAPVNWAADPAQADRLTARPAVVLPPLPRFGSALAQGLKRKALFWKSAEGVVQLSLFGPPEIAPGQRANFLVYAHSPETFSNVITLCRAMRSESELLGAGYLEVPVRRGVDVSVHMALAHAGVAKSLVKFTWIGQTQPRTFEIFVPWESPAGLTSGVVTAGIDKTMVASIPLHFVIPPRLM